MNGTEFLTLTQSVESFFTCVLFVRSGVGSFSLSGLKKLFKIKKLVNFYQSLYNEFESV